MILLSGSGTLRTILVLLILWLLLRAWMRSRTMGPGRPPGTHWGSPDHRPQGEVRIERPEDAARNRPPSSIEDADFEEIDQPPNDDDH